MSLDYPVDDEIYRAVANAVSPEFAFSYLLKAEQHGRAIVPFTMVAWDRLTKNPYAMDALQKLRCTVTQPEPYSEAREERKRQQRAGRALLERQREAVR